MANWRADAKCAEPLVDRELFFPRDGDDPRSQKRRVKAAVAICAQCIVRDDCLHDALDRGEKNGIWGGEVFDQRHHFDDRKVEARCATCGRLFLRDGVFTHDCRCDDCLTPSELLRARANELRREQRARKRAGSSR